MPSSLEQFCTNLKSCTLQLESDVRLSWKEIAENYGKCSESDVVLDKAVDYHYQEILHHLKEMKNHIDIIVRHEIQIRSIKSKILSGAKNGNRTSCKIDRDYIKKQIDTFQSLEADNTVHKREVKSHHRTSHNSSMKYLNAWERFLEKTATENRTPDDSPVPKRRTNNSLRKKKKFVSSTVDQFLDQSSEDGDKDESDKTYFNTENDILESDESTEDNVVNTKPKIVDVMYKSTNSLDTSPEISEDIESLESKPKIVDVVYKHAR